MSRMTVVFRLCKAIAFLPVASVAAPQADAERHGDTQDPVAVVVTAQKREQNLQNVPITVTAFSSQQLQAAGIHDIKNLTILTPGLTVTSTSSEAITTARIRGIGTVGDNPGLESSVGVVIDGVYRPRNGVGFGDLGELQRIEILKGPQGTIFGKNTSAGVIQVLTEPPKFEFGAKAELTGGDTGIRGGSVAITGPVLGDRIAGRLYVSKRKRDGFYDVHTGSGPRELTEDGTQEYVSTRGQLLWLPTESVCAFQPSRTVNPRHGGQIGAKRRKSVIIYQTVRHGSNRGGLYAWIPRIAIGCDGRCERAGPRWHRRCARRPNTRASR